MNNFLYDLLPGIYRQLDQQEGMPLQALLEAIEEERQRLLADTHRLYTDLVIETCHDVAIAKIAGLLDLPPLLTRRNAVANTLASNRRKGTLGALERRLTDASGWPALSAFAPPLDPQNPKPGTKLVTRVWRQPVYPVQASTPYLIGDSCYTFHPMGVDMPLFHLPTTDYDADRSLSRVNMPVQLTLTSKPHLLPPLAVFLEGKAHPLPVVLADLSQWIAPTAPPSVSEPFAAVDPTLGRLMVQPADGPPVASVSYAYAFTADIGGGPYPRTLTAPTAAPWIAYVQSNATPNLQAELVFNNFADALAAFSASPCQGTILFLDSATYELPDTLIDTGDWVCPKAPENGRTLLLQAINGEVPCLHGSLRLQSSGFPLTLTLDGLWIDGTIVAGGLLTLDLRDTTVRPSSALDTTVQRGISTPDGDQSQLLVVLNACICGPIELPGSCGGLHVTASIVDAIRNPPPPPNVPPPAATFPLVLTNSTVFGAITGASVTCTHSLVDEAASFYASIVFGSPNYARPWANVATPSTCGPDVREDGAFRSVDTPHRCRQLYAALQEALPDQIPHEFLFRT